MYGSMISSFSAVNGNYCKMFSRLELYVILAVLFRSALASHGALPRAIAFWQSRGGPFFGGGSRWAGARFQSPRPQ
jgi:hypothetical protein